MSIGNCPDCGWPIYQGHVAHACPVEMGRDEGPGLVITTSFGPFDTVLLRRSELAGQLDADSAGRNTDEPIERTQGSLSWWTYPA